MLHPAPIASAMRLLVRRSLRILILPATVMAVAAPLAAAPRDLPVPADKGWQHAETGLILMPKLAGLQRTELKDLGTSELDVEAQYQSPDAATIATVYLFRPAVMSVPLWFDRSQTQIRERKQVYGNVAPVTPPQAFAPPGTTTPSALRQTFQTGKTKYNTTSLAVLPLGSWLVAVRLSMTSFDAASIDREMGGILDAIRWPSNRPAAEAAAPVQACPGSLPTRHAHEVKPDMSQTLLSSVISSAVADQAKSETSTPVTWCRVGDATTAFGVYTQPDATNYYTIAFGDAGRTATVGPAFSLDGPSNSYSVIFHDLDSSSVYPSFDALPLPSQVVGLINDRNPLSRTSSDGKQTQVTIDTGK